MKKTMLGLASVFVCVITVVSCEIPQSITVKGKPRVYIPLGSPFSNVNEADRLENQISSTKIKEMMGTGTNGVNVYDYTGNSASSEVQTYVVHYPIAEIDLDSLTYVNNVPNDRRLTPDIPGAPTSYSINGDYTIKPTLKNFLGSDVTYKEAPGYIYVDGIGDDSTISLSYSNTGPDTKLINDDTPLDSLPGNQRPVFPSSEDQPFTNAIPISGRHSIRNNNSIDMIDILNSRSDTKLKYQIKIPAAEIIKGKSNHVIKVDLIIRLPLEFKVFTQSELPDYVKLDMGDAFPKLGNGDLFGRTGDSDNDLLENIDEVKIALKSTDNNIINGISLLVVVKNTKPRLELEAGKSVEFKGNDLNFPFSPQFEIVIKKETGQNYGTFLIKRQGPNEPPVFDFFLTIEAQANINQTTTL